jgi:hypothetical protein
LVASVASVVALAVAAPFTHIGRLDSSDGRLWVAAIAAALVPGMLAVAAWSASAKEFTGVVLSVLVAGFALAIFAWAANPPIHATIAVVAPKGLDVAEAADDTGVQISYADAGHLLATHGIPGSDVESYVLSFYGPIDAETLAKGTKVWRYGAQAEGSGRFVTATNFPNPTETQLALHLPYWNTAVCKAPVTVTKRTLVLDGAIAFGKPGERQIVILDPSAFSFGHGSAYSSTPCK